ncbi:MAG: hypothetical protein OES46_19475 [Gammaproteobacteria bacterium]|jgi:cytoskeletal protein RodZ|nr:hypothetical protein [Gammaproteobacteria bacterium]
MSIHTTAPPDDDRLAALIGEAFEALPSPDRWKLKHIEERLSRALTRKPQARKPSMWAWWLAGALVVGSATAWWVYQSHKRAAETESLNPVVEQIMPLETPDEREPKATQPEALLSPIDATTKTHEDANQQRRPTIFRRETY